MKIAGAWLDNSDTQTVMGILQSEGHKAFFVGGCVRNAILDLPVGDIDIATDAHPEQVTRIASAAGLRVVPIGIDHGTVTVISGKLAHEVTTFRRDMQTDGRRAIVSYSTDIKEDAARRDFTMNALYALADGTVMDPMEGLRDLLTRRVRFVGRAQQRIREDYLRILRFFRFQAIYGDPEQGIDAEGLAACAANSDGLKTLSRDRVSAELRKLLSAADPSLALSAMEHAGILTQILPGTTARAIPVLVHLEGYAPRSWLCRLAVLGGGDIAAKLRLGRKEVAMLERMSAEIGLTTPADALGFKGGIALAGDILHARAALLATPLPEQWQSDVLRGTRAVFPVTAADLMPGLEGPALGAKLTALLEVWLGSGLTLTRADLLS